jgi:4-carboxymuconolactone decarboxylase
MLPKIVCVASFLFGTSLANLSLAQDRMPPIPPAQYSEEQTKAAAEFLEARKVPVFGPFEPLMRSPEVMNKARAMGDYLRYHSAIGNTLSELAILITAREWSQDYEWSLHQPIALKAGMKPEIAAAIAEGRRPEGMSEDEEIVYDFSTELFSNKRVSNRAYERALQRFGEEGVIDLTSIAGYYAYLAMVLNVSHMPALKDGPVLKRFPD